MNYRKLNSLLFTITPETGTKKGTLAFMPSLEINKLYLTYEVATTTLS